MSEEETSIKGKIPQGIKKQRQALHSNFGKYVSWGYLIFVIFTIGYFLKPEGGEQTILHSNRYDVDIVYERTLTKAELPQYDPIVWERDHIKSEDFTIRYVDQSGWDYERYKLSSIDIAWILMTPVIFVGVLQTIGAFLPSNKVKRVFDTSEDVYYTKRRGIKKERGYFEIQIYDAYRIPILNIWWLRDIGYTVRAHNSLVTHNNNHAIVVNGRIAGYNVVIERDKNYQKMIETMIKLEHEQNVNKTYEEIVQDNYKVPAKIVGYMMGLIENVVKAVHKAEGDKSKEGAITKNAMRDLVKAMKVLKSVKEIE